MILHNRKMSKSAFRLIKQAKIDSYKKELIEQAKFEFESEYNRIQSQPINETEYDEIYGYENEPLPEYSKLNEEINAIIYRDYNVQLPSEFIEVEIESIRLLDIIKAKFKSAPDRRKSNLIELLALFRHTAEIRTYVILA